MTNEKNIKVKENVLKAIIGSIVAIIIFRISNLPYTPIPLLSKIWIFYDFAGRLSQYNDYVMMFCWLLINCLIAVILGVSLGLFNSFIKLPGINFLILGGFILGVMVGVWDANHLAFCGSSTYLEIISCKVRYTVNFGVSFSIYGMLLGAAFKR